MPAFCCQWENIIAKDRLVTVSPWATCASLPTGKLTPCGEVLQCPLVLLTFTETIVSEPGPTPGVEASSPSSAKLGRGSSMGTRPKLVSTVVPKLLHWISLP